MKNLSIRQINRLYLISLLLVVTIGSIIQTLSFSWGLIGTELFLILLPVLWIHRKNQLSLKQSVLLNKPRASVGLVALMMGAGAWMMDSFLENFLIYLTGYTASAGLNILPKNLFEGVLIFVAFAVAAPICEEFLFRGTIQQAYQREKSAGSAIFFAGLMFVLYHLRFQGFLSLIPIALILGYIYWRTRSLYASILAHFANNIFSVVLILQAAFFPDVQLPIPSVTAASFGILLIVAGLFLLNRLIPTVPAEETEQDEPAAQLGFFKVYWPLLTAVLIFVVFAVLEVFNGTKMGSLELDHTLMPQQAFWTYEVRHKGNEVVGEAECRLQQLDLVITLDCTRENQAYELQLGNSFYSSADMQTTLHVAWNQEDLSISRLEQTDQAENYLSETVIKQESFGPVLYVTQNGTQQARDFPPEALFEDEWAWRLIALPFQKNLIAQTDYVVPLMWREKTKDSGPVLYENYYIAVLGQETIDVPAGTFDTWKVSLNNLLTVWYDVQTPHSLVKFESRMFDYALSEMSVSIP